MSLPARSSGPSSSPPPPADAHTAANEWDDEEGEAVEAESRAHAANETVIVPIEARPPPVRQSSTEDDAESDDDESSDDGAEIRLPPAPLPVMAPRGSSAGTVVRASPGLIIARTSPAAAAAAAVEAAASASLLHDAISNPPPPPPSAAAATSASAANDPAKPSRSPGVNVISIPKPKKQEEGVKQEEDAAAAADEDAMDDEAAAEDEEDGASDSYTPQDDEEGNVKMEDEPAASSAAAAAPSLSLTSAGGAKLRLILPKNPSANGAAKARSSSPTDAVKLESGRTQAAAANPSSSHAASSSSAFASPAPRALIPNSLIPPTTGLTPHGKATLSRYRSYFFGRQWPDAKLLRISGREITEKWMNECAMRVPFIATSAAEIGLRAPGPDTSIRTVCESLPPAHVLSVIDVATQSESSAWSLAQWVSYYETPVEQRTAVCNVISLEISNSEFAKSQLLAPKFARDLSWSKLWPTEAQATVASIKTPTSQQRLVPGAAPSAASASSVAAPATEKVAIPPMTPVALYCLMGTAGSYTDWHADFGGSSVWYHVVRGQKLFLIAEPTAANLAVYEQWHRNGKALTTFLADRFAERDRAQEAEEGLEAGSLNTVKLFAVNAGETLFVPSGYIHAVYTPVDSLVFGGNFLHGYSISSQLCIYNLELNTNVEPRFQYPNFESLNWLAMREWVFRLRKPLAQMHVTLAELNGLATLVKTAANWMEQSAIGVRDGYEAARPRRGSKAPVSGHHQVTADAAAQSRPDHLDWAHNIPISWNDAVTLLRELDCLLIYHSYLIEREDFDDRMESRREAAEAAGSSSADGPSATDELSLDGWSRREQLAQKCFQLLESFSSQLYPIVPMVAVYSLPFLRKPKSRSQRMSAADSAATIASALKPKSQRSLAAFEIEEKAAPAPTTSGRVRQHVARYREYVTDDEDEEDEDGEGGGKRSKSGAGAATAAAAAASSQGACMADDEEKESSRPAAAAAAPAPLPARKRRTPPPQVFSGSESDDDAFSSDVESDAPQSEEEEGYDAAGNKKRKARGGKGSKSKKARKGDEDDAAAAGAAPAAAATPVGPIKLSELKARAAAAAAASMSTSKKVIPAGAAVGPKKPRKPAAPKSAAALAAASIGKAKPALSAKARIMQKLGLSGKLR